MRCGENWRRGVVIDLLSIHGGVPLLKVPGYCYFSPARVVVDFGMVKTNLRLLAVFVVP
jgi:hypothetical protein